jgi:enolase-phosphatase E1
VPRPCTDPNGGRYALSAIQVFLLDVEGTTTPIDFVTRALFPYARRHAGAFLASRGADTEVAADLARLREENSGDVARDQAPPWGAGSVDEIVSYVHWLMDRDRKSTGLKALQGRIWEDGYRRGDLRGELYGEVPAAFRRWRESGRRVAIFSSGSVLAQQLLFRHSTAGDLTPFLEAHFDTTTGPKREARSYALIADRLGAPPPGVLFVSDVAQELDAARAAGMDTALCARQAPPDAATHRIIRSFDDLGS